MNGQIVYLSGPMFSIGDQWEQTQVAKTLEDQGYQTYLPQRDGIEVGQLMALLADPNVGTQLAQQGLAIVRPVRFCTRYVPADRAMHMRGFQYRRARA